MARTAVSEVVEKIRRQMAASMRGELNILNGSHDASITTITFTYDLPASLVAGAVISVETESMYVLAVSTTNRTATVIRGWQDSTGATHASGTEAWINPRFTGFDIFEALYDELAGMPTGIYKVYGDTIAVADAAQTLELPAAYTGLYGLTDVRRNWTAGDSTAWPRLNVRLQTGVGATWDGAATSGVLLRFIDLVSAGNLYVEAALPLVLTTFTSATDLVSDVGLPATALDVAVMGVKTRLMVDQEMGRSQRSSQDDSRAAEEVPPGAALSAANAQRSYYMQRRAEEIARLAALHPIRVQ